MIDYGWGVILTGIKNEDEIKTIFDYRNDPKIYKWNRQIGTLHYSEHVNYWSHILETDQTHSRFYLIKDEKQKNILGVTGFTSIDPINSRAEFSLYIARQYQRKGCGKAGLKTLFKFGFQELNLNLIWGETLEHNPAQFLFEKIGMVYEGLRRDFYFKGGQYVNAKLYSIRRSEWKF